MMEGLAYLREMNVASVLLRLTVAMLFGGLHRTGAGAEAPAGRLPDLYAGMFGRGADHAAQSV